MCAACSGALEAFKVWGSWSVWLQGLGSMWGSGFSLYGIMSTCPGKEPHSGEWTSRIAWSRAAALPITFRSKSNAGGLKVKMGFGVS